MDTQQGGMQKTCGCPHHKMVPGLIVLIGLLFLLHAFNAISETVVMVGWPILLVLIGLMKMSKGMCKCCGMGTHC